MEKKQTSEEKASEVLNPFDKGVSYADFLASLPKGVTVAEALKDICTQDDIKWIETEIETYKNNLKTK